MALTSHMPSYGCEHLNKDNISKIEEFRTSKHNFDSVYIQYTCITCSLTASFKDLDKHFAKSKHEFAISQKSLYCGRCNDLVYEPSLVLRGANGKRRKVIKLSEEDESYISQNTMPRPCGREGVRGLFNLGETCYMNAILQMMVHNPLLASYFLGMGHPLHTCPISKEPEKKGESDDSEDEANGDGEKEQKTCVACGMTELFSDSYMVDQTIPAHAVNLLFASWKNIPHMSGKGQQDAQEWFMLIVDKLHEAVTNSQVQAANSHCNSSMMVNGYSSKPLDKQKHCPCFFHKVFYGRFFSDVTCDTCHNVTTSEEEYSSLSLDFKKQVKRKKKEVNSTLAINKEKESGSTKISLLAPSPTPTLHDCLKSYTANETLSQENYSCPSCKTPRSATKRIRIRKLPAILCVHVKRFGMKKIGGVPSGVAEKYEGKLDFPLTLDMGPYCTGSSVEENGGHIRKGHEIYDLDCVVVHQGEHSHTGHYFAFCRIGGVMAGANNHVGGDKADSVHHGGTQGGKWYRFDDEIVSATTTEDVLRQEAYLLFYGLRNIGSGNKKKSEDGGSA